MSDLDARLLAAHAADDRSALVSLYEEAADQAADEDARGFYLTHAFIFALDVGSPRATPLEAQLRAMKRA